MKALLFFVFLLFASGCYFPSGPTELTSAQVAAIRDRVDDVDSTVLEAVLDDLYTVPDKFRHVTVGNIAVYEERIKNYFPSSYNVETQPVTTHYVLAWNNSTKSFYTKYYSIPKVMNNIIAVKAGNDPPVVVIAHWDSVPCGPGIDDNGSGCAGVLEIARVTEDLNFRYKVVFILFAFEEEGLLGSSHYAGTMQAYPKAVVNLEMIGYTSPNENPYPLTDVLLNFPRTGNFIAVFATDFSDTLGFNFINAADLFVPELEYYFFLCDPNFSNNPLLSLLLRSDHTPFWERNIPAIMVTDTAELREGSPYHTLYDTKAEIDMDFMTNVVKASLATVCIEAVIE